MNDIDTYIAGFPPSVQDKLQQVRTTIRKAAPEATEAIAYAMPTFKLFGNLVHFAGYKNHIGFYPAPSAIVAFRNQLTPYRSSKGAVQFPLDQALPLNLIRDMVKFRMTENLAKKKERPSRLRNNKG